MSTAEPRLPTCYRHPDRETGLSCSDCGRPICADCANFGPVGIRCPDGAYRHASPVAELDVDRIDRHLGILARHG